MRKQVLLAMSGGIDSSVAAYLLQQDGYEVIGLTFRFYEPEDVTDYLDDAAYVAEKLNFRHIVHDARDLFQSKVLDYFCHEYMNGRTPMPCARCNNLLKWPLLVEFADKMGIPFIATGHYVGLSSVENKFYFTIAKDPDKDQSFFLWGVSASTLQRLLLPLGNKLKTEVIEIARQQGFKRIVNKSESMGACFCPDDYRPVLRRLVHPVIIEPGRFLDTEDRFLGRHDGYPFYTVGQRRGLSDRLQEPHFVHSIDPERNVVVLAKRSDMYVSEMALKGVRYLSVDDFSDWITCRVRYRKQQVRAQVCLCGDEGAFVFFEQPVEAVAPGQTAVFYKEDRLIGGGFIV